MQHPWYPQKKYSSCPVENKTRAYQALIRPKLEYLLATWNSYINEQVNLLESVQHQTAWFVLNYYDHTTTGPF